MNSLSDPAVATTLEHLHRQARGDRVRLIGTAPRFLLSKFTGRDLMPANTPKQAYMAVTRPQGMLLYLLATASRAQRIVEFGCSFGVSTLYLAAAARDTGGLVVTTEIEPAKCEATEANLSRAGLGDVATVVPGDAIETLGGIDGPIDFVFLDGNKRLYVPILSTLRPKLRPGAIVVADNADTPQARPYVEHITSHEPELASVPLFNGRTLVSAVV